MMTKRVPVGLYEEALSEIQAKEDKLYDAVNDIETLIDYIEDLVEGKIDDVQEILDFCETLKDQWAIGSIKF